MSEEVYPAKLNKCQITPEKTLTMKIVDLLIPNNLEKSGLSLRAVKFLQVMGKIR